MDDLAPIQPHHREDRAELDHDGEDAAGIVEAEQRARQSAVRGGRDGQELGEPLNDPEQRGGRAESRSVGGLATPVRLAGLRAPARAAAAACARPSPWPRAAAR